MPINIGAGVWSANTPTRVIDTAAVTIWIAPSSADAEPATAPWSSSDNTPAAGNNRPRKPKPINSSVIIRARLSLHRVVTASRTITAATLTTDQRINGARPKRALRRAVSWLMAKNDAALRAKHRLNWVGVRPKYSMYTNGALPINTKNVARPNPQTTDKPVKTGSWRRAP